MLLLLVTLRGILELLIEGLNMEVCEKTDIEDVDSLTCWAAATGRNPNKKIRGRYGK